MPTPLARNKYVFCGIWGDRVLTSWTKTVVNGLAMAHYGLILCQHGATTCTDLLEALLHQYRPIWDQICPKMLEFWGSQVSHPYVIMGTMHVFRSFHMHSIFIFLKFWSSAIAIIIWYAASTFPSILFI